MIKRNILSKDDKHFILVPKCATTTMIKELDDWEEQTLDTLPASIDKVPQHYYGLVRYPVQRWVSGMAQAFGGVQKEYHYDLLMSGDADTIGSYVTCHSDTHLKKQSLYYEHVPNLKLLRMSGSWQYNIAKALQISPIESRENLASEGNKWELYNHILPYAETVLRDDILKAYKDDLELYERSQF
jgi:hypothetical protein